MITKNIHMSKEEIKSKPFRGNPTEFIESPWLSSEDLLGSGVTQVELEIEDVEMTENVKAQDGKIVDKVLFLKFKKAKKRMWLNTTNIRNLTRLFGKTEDWPGKTVTLTVEEVRAFGKNTRGLRIVVPTSIVKKPV